MSERLNKINSLLKKVISEVICKDLENPKLRLYLYTITHVKTTPDLQTAEVYVSVLGDEQKSKEGFEMLCKHLKVIQRLVAAKIQLKYSPKLHLNYDDSIAYAFKISKIIDDINEPSSKD